MNTEEIYDLELKFQEVYNRTKDYTRNDFVIELIKKEDEKQELIEYLKNQINECPLMGNDEADMFYTGKMRAFQQVLSKIERE